jgi:hypothetical protein
VAAVFIHASVACSFCSRCLCVALFLKNEENNLL